MTPRDFALCSVFAFVLPAGQMMFKWAALYSGRLEGSFLVRLLQNYPLFMAFAWYGATAVLWYYILIRVPLTNAYAFSIVGSALVPIMAWLVFREPMSWRLAAGYALMIAGFIVTQGRS